MKQNNILYEKKIIFNFKKIEHIQFGMKKFDMRNVE